MEVVRNSDIAQLVLGYLRDQNLEEAANSFCKTSPYLREEYRLLKKGLRTISLGSGTLVDIIKEHCHIKSKVSQFIDALPTDDKERNRILNQNTLVGKVSFLTKFILHEKKSEKQINRNRGVKRTRSIESFDGVEGTKIQDLPGFDSVTQSKRRRISGSYFFLSNSTMVSEVETEDDRQKSSDSDTSLVQTKTNALSNDSRDESLSTNTSLEELNSVPEITDLSETILKKTEFQNVLVENINKALKDTTSRSCLSENKKTNENPLSNEITTIDFDEMIKNILNATEKDPTFNEVIEEAVVLTNSAKKSHPTNDNKSISPMSPNYRSKLTKDTVSQTNIQKTHTSNKATQMSPTKEIESSQNQNVVITKSTSAIIENNVCVNETNSSFVDSSFSSKFILLNSNDTLATLGNDSILSCANLNNEQVFIDISTGQMTIPFVVSNENVALPILINNSDFTTNQNEEGRDNEIQTASAVGFQLSTNENEKSENVSQSTKTSLLSTNAINIAKITSNSLDKEKETPKRNALNIPQLRSFSTPRRRASHIRVLNFGTPPKEQKQISQEKSGEVFQESEVSQQVPSVAQNIEIQTSLKSTSLQSQIPNEMASNSNSFNFDIENSNQTVIQKEIISDTPRRKSNGKSCIRTLSHSNNEEDRPLAARLKGIIKKKKIIDKKNLINKKKKVSPKTKTKTKKISSKAKKVDEIKDTSVKFTKTELDENDELDPMEKWNKMRATFSNPNWDQHLRVLQSKSLPDKSNKKSKQRSKKCSKTSKREKESDEIKQKDKNKESSKESQLKKTSSTVESKTKISRPSPNLRPKKNLITFKIPTPGKKISKSVKIKENKENKKDSHVQEKNETTASTAMDENVQEQKDIAAISESQPVQNKNSKESDPEANTSKNFASKPKEIQVTNKQSSEEKRKQYTENIALLLETPFKTDGVQIPITPRFIVPQAEETPITKLMKSIQFPSAHRLLDIDTPNFAITPGAGLIHKPEKDTPISGTYSNRPTDYSSGGSYYRPDESDDLDKYLDRLLDAERKKAATKMCSTSTNTNPESCKERAIVKDADRSNKETKKIENVSESTTIINKNDNSPSKNKGEKHNSSKECHHSTDQSSNSNSSLFSESSTSYTLSDVDSSEDEEWKQSLTVIDKQKNDKDTLTEDKNKILEICKSTSGKNVIHEINKTKQLSDLEEKRLRMKEKLKEDLKTKVVKVGTVVKAKKQRTVIMIKPRKLVTRSSLLNARKAINEEKKLVDSNVERISPSGTSSKDNMDVLRALNLSAKKIEPAAVKQDEKIKQQPSNNHKLTTSFVIQDDNAVTKDIFEREQISKNRSIEDNSRESAESVKVRNAAMALTTLQKKLASQISHDKIEVTRQKHRINDDGTSTRELFESKAHLDFHKCSTKSQKTKIAIKSKSISKVRKRSPDIQYKSSPRNVKLSSRAKALFMTSPKTAKKLYHPQPTHQQPMQTRSSKRLENIPGKKVNETKKCSRVKTQLKPKRNVKKLNEENTDDNNKNKDLIGSEKSPAITKQPKVVLELLTDEQIHLNPSSKRKSSKSTENQRAISAQENKTNSSADSTIKNPLPKVELTVSKDDNNVTNFVYTLKDSETDLHGANKNCDNNEQQSTTITTTIEEHPNSNLIPKNSKIDKNENENNAKNRVDNENVEEEDEVNDDYDDEENQKEEKEDEDENEDEDQEEEEDAYDECEMITIDENDEKRFIHIIHSDSSDNIPNYSQQFDENILHKEMKIFLNNVPHKIKVTDEIELFAKKPSDINERVNYRKAIKNIPKKREKNAHIIHYDTESCSISTNQNKHNPVNNSNSDSGKDDNDSTYESSTPCKPKFRLQYKDRSEKKSTKKRFYKQQNVHSSSSEKKPSSNFPKKSLNIEKKKADGPSSDNILNEPTSTTSDDLAKVLRQEDIYAVLSHLHGTDEVKL